MDEYEFQCIRQEKVRLNTRINVLEKKLEELSNSYNECIDKNNYLKSKLAEAEKAAYRISDYENERCKLTMENCELHDTIGVLSEEITRLRQIIKESHCGGIQSNI